MLLGRLDCAVHLGVTGRAVRRLDEFEPLGEILTPAAIPFQLPPPEEWKYRKEIETIGRVVAIVIRSTPSR